MKNKKKILIVSECFYPEEFKINDLALFWKEKGYEVSVLTLIPTYPFGKIYNGYKNRLITKEVYQGIKIYRILAITGYQNSILKKILRYVNFMIFGTIAAVIIGRRYSFVFGYNMAALSDMVPAIVIRKLYKKPLMLWVQDIWPDSVYAYGFKKTKFLSYSLNIFVKFVYQNVTAIAISSKGFESKLKTFVKSDLKFNYAPNWAEDLDLSVNAIDYSEKKKVHFTFAGNIGMVQNLENIINAFDSISKQNKTKAQLNIIGDGSNLEHLKKLAKHNESIVFLGKKKLEDMAEYYNGSDFLIVSLIDKPIFSLTVPSKTQTYIAAKKPILGIIKGETAQIILENNLGICADPSNVDSISRSFDSCIEMTYEQRIKYIENSDYLLKTIFNEDIIKNKLTDSLIN